MAMDWQAMVPHMILERLFKREMTEYLTGRDRKSWLAILLLLWLCTHLRAQETPGVQLAPVKLAEIIEEVPLTGTVNALRTSQLSPAVAGLITEVAVEVGERVTRGDLLFALDDEKARFELQGVEAGIREARTRLKEAQRRVDEALSIGSGQNIAATEISSRKSQAAALKATLARLEANGKRQQAVLRRHQIRAPYDSVVSERSMDLGEWVTPGDELLTLVDHTHLRLDFQIPQKYYPRISNRSIIWVAPLRQEAPSWQAPIDTLVPVGDPQARTFLLRAVASEQSGLQPGMAVQATLRLPSGSRGLTIPRDALNRYPEGRVTVWIAEPEESDLFRVREQRVRTGIGFEGLVVITDGLRENEQVVSRGNEALEAGMVVRISDKGAD